MKVLELLPGRADEHIPHEQGMVCSGAYDADIDTIPLVPSCEAVDDVDSVSGVEVVDGAFPVDFPDLPGTNGLAEIIPSCM